MKILNPLKNITQTQQTQKNIQQNHIKKPKKTKNLEESEEVRKIPITLKINLKNVPICAKLRRFEPQIFSELVNQPINKSNNISIGRSFKNIINKTITKIQDNNLGQVDINLFSKTGYNQNSFLTDNKYIDVAQMTPFQMQEPSSGLFEENKFKKVINENYSFYTQKIKQIYPSFKFNHYSNKNNNDINDTDLIMKENDSYVKNNLLENLGLHADLFSSSDNFKILIDFLALNDVNEIVMLQNDLSLKIGILNQELNAMLKIHAGKLLNFYEKNLFLKNEIETYLDNIKYKQFIKKDCVKKYTVNSISLVAKGSKKNKILKIISNLNTLKNIKEDILDLGKKISKEKIKDKNQIKQISHSINLIKEKVKNFKNNFESSDRLIIINEIEKEIKNLESKVEESLNSEFHKNIDELFNLFVLYEKKKSTEEQKEQKKTNWDLSLEKSKDKTSGVFFINDDFELIEEKTNLYIKYLLIYNNMKNNKIYLKLLEIMDLFEIINKDGIDINSILKVFIDVLKNIIINNFDYIEKESNNKIVIIYIIANCYAILLSNYFYILQLIQKNFGISMKLFTDVTKILITEMDKFISIVILAYLHEIIFDREWIEFLNGLLLAKKYSLIYISNTSSKLNWDALTNDVFREYVSNFNNTVTNNLLTEIKNMKFNEINNIDIDYQHIM